MYIKSLLRLAAPLLVASNLVASAPTSHNAADNNGTSATQSFYVNNNGTKIHYTKTGSGPPLIFLHGFPDGSQTWHVFQVPYFSDKYTCITPDLRGYPPSDVPTDPAAYDMTLLVSDVKAVLDQEGIDNVTVISHDWGGTVAWMFADQYPTRTRALITLNGDSPTVGDLLEFDPDEQRMAQYALPFEAWQPGQPKNISDIVINYRNTTYAAQVAAYLDASPIVGMMNWYKENFPTPPWGQAQPFVYHTVPSLLLWGEGDVYFSSKTINNLVGHYLDGVRLVTITNAGHWVHMDQPDRVNRELQSFFDMYNL